MAPLREHTPAELQFMSKLADIQDCVAMVLAATVKAQMLPEKKGGDYEKHRVARRKAVLNLQKKARELAALHFVTMKEELGE